MHAKKSTAVGSYRTYKIFSITVDYEGCLLFVNMLRHNSRYNLVVDEDVKKPNKQSGTITKCKHVLLVTLFSPSLPLFYNPSWPFNVYWAFSGSIARHQGQLIWPLVSVGGRKGIEITSLWGPVVWCHKGGNWLISWAHHGSFPLPWQISNLERGRNAVAQGKTALF